jgi:hypothetical protein
VTGVEELFARLARIRTELAECERLVRAIGDKSHARQLADLIERAGEVEGLGWVWMRGSSRDGALWRQDAKCGDCGVEVGHHNSIPLDLGLPNFRVSTHSTVSTVSTIQITKVSKYPLVEITDE